MIVSKILGGINAMQSSGTNILYISGGFTADSKHIENKQLIGNMVKTYIKNRILEWESFKETYYKNGSLEHDKDYKNLLCVLNDIMPLPIYTTNEDELLFLIKNIYTASPNEISTALTKSMPLNNPIQASIRHLFMTYKIYIENTIELFVKLREEYLKQHNLVKNNKHNDFIKLVDRWNTIDMENKLNTSSLILFFNFIPTNAKLEKTIPTINWNITGSNKLISNAINKFLAAVKKTKFNYVGYCPHVSVMRFKLLLKFPIKELLDMISLIDFNKKYRDMNSKCSKIIPKVIDLQHKADILHITPKLKLNTKKLPKKLDINTFSKSMSVKAKTQIFEEYIKLYIKLYNDIAPHLIKKERQINDLAVGINIVAKDLSHLI